MERFSALIGFVGILAIAFLLSNNRRAIRWKTVFWGLTLQILTAIAVLKGTQIAHAVRHVHAGDQPVDRRAHLHRADGDRRADRQADGAGRAGATALWASTSSSAPFSSSPTTCWPSSSRT